MIRNILFVLTIVASQMQLFAGNKAPKVTPPCGLLCNLLDAQRQPGIHQICIASRFPAFSWMMDSCCFASQQAYMILLSDTPDDRSQGNVWNSGWVNSAASTGIRYTGEALKPSRNYFWKVRIRDTKGNESPFSACYSFRTDSLLTDHASARYALQTTQQQARILLQTPQSIRADFGADAFARLKLTLTTDRKQSLQIRLGEALNADGSINRQPGGTIRYASYSLEIQPGTHCYPMLLIADQRNTGPNAIKLPDSLGVIMPFRYVEIEGFDGTLSKNDLVRTVVNYPFDDRAASFHSSDSVLNKVWELCKYSVKATSFAGIYVDGDRERIPYEADALINQLCHYTVDREYSLARYTHEYLINKPNWPTEWILQSVLLAGYDYQYTGDIHSARQFYTDLSAKALMPLQDSTGLISLKNLNPSILAAIHYNGDRPLENIVDWPHSGMLGVGKQEAGETDGFVFSDYNAVVNAYYYKALLTMAAIAADLGYTNDVERYLTAASHLHKAFRSNFWDADKGVFCDGIATRHASLHSNFFALAFGLVAPAERESVLRFIRSRGMACSVYGSQFLLDALFDNHDANYAIELLTATTDRSWYNMLRAGSTITMEAWDNKYKPNQDWNHAWGAAPANVITRKLMGIEPTAPGWSRFKIEPQPGKLSAASIRVPTIKGTVELQLQNSSKKMILTIRIPGNTLADVYFPEKDTPISQVMINGDLVKLINKKTVMTKLNPGFYKINVVYK